MILVKFYVPTAHQESLTNDPIARKLHNLLEGAETYVEIVRRDQPIVLAVISEVPDDV